MKKTKVYIVSSILLVILSYILFFSKITSRISIALFLTIYAIITSLIIKKSNTLSIRKKEVTKLMLLLGFIYVALLYTAGIYTGYYKASVTLSVNSIFRYIIPIIVIIISSESIRHKLVNYSSKILAITNFCIQVIIDLLIYANLYKFSTLEEIMIVIGYVLFASIAGNLLYNYISLRYGKVPNIVYRIFTTIYLYIIPIVPDIHIFFLSFYKLIYPFTIYYILESFYGEEDALEIKHEKLIQIITTILTILLVIYIALISCLFSVGALVIGSGSMTGTIDKGDVIIFNKNINIDDISEGDIIVFHKNNIKVVHRVVVKKKTNGEYRLITKGDYNKSIDDGYITENDLYGKVVLKISDIGLPTVWLHDVFDK